MVPEILHRCPSCGASVRDLGGRAMFCPECGKNLTGIDAEKEEPENLHVVEENAAASDEQPPEFVSPQEVDRISAADAEVETSKTTFVEDRHTARERTRETLHRASTRARGAIEDNVKRVEKIHHVSSVMFEEAHYDPSLRFVLVALGLFVVFVILLILSKVMG
jgi:predicted  nucleic acid-binding Zn-ribbon protein